MKIIALIICLSWLVACAPGRYLSDNETTIVAWYCEDLARGTPRQPGEIQVVDPSDSMKQVIRWLTGSVVRDVVVPPPQLSSRSQRWPALRGLFTSHMAVIVGDGPDRGLIAPRRGMEESDVTTVTPLIDAENSDRRTIDALVIATAGLTGSAVERLRNAITAARLELDGAAGATVWNPNRP